MMMDVGAKKTEICSSPFEPRVSAALTSRDLSGPGSQWTKKVALIPLAHYYPHTTFEP